MHTNVKTHFYDGGNPAPDRGWCGQMITGSDRVQHRSCVHERRVRALKVG